MHVQKTISFVMFIVLLAYMSTSVRASIGANIDIYTQYPYPHGGQGKNQPSDPFAPRDEVTIFALVTYNLAPVENKIVSFEISSPTGKIHCIRTAATSKDGIANLSFRIPLPDPDVFGTWSVLGTVDVAGGVYKDTLIFEVSAQVHKVGDLGGGIPPTFFAFDNIVDSKDLDLFLQCYRGIAPPETMYLADLGGGTPPQFFAYDGKVDGKDLTLFLLCLKGLGP